jgi:hypothetical protein
MKRCKKLHVAALEGVNHSVFATAARKYCEGDHIVATRSHFKRQHKHTLAFLKLYIHLYHAGSTIPESI